MKKTGDKSEDLLRQKVAELVIANEEKAERADELVIANTEKAKRAAELVIANEEKEKRAAELVIANADKAKRAAELVIARAEKAKRAFELIIANAEKEKREDELIIADKELVYQNEEKAKRAAELVIADINKSKREAELVIANIEKAKRIAKSIIADKELVYQNEEKAKRAAELVIADAEKSKRAAELVIAKIKKAKLSAGLVIANIENAKRAAELVIAKKELAYQKSKKAKRAAELVIANIEKAKRAAELVIANIDKSKRAAELVFLNKELVLAKEKEKLVAELIIVNKELNLQIDVRKLAEEALIIAKEHAEESDRLKSAFLANMSHEIRTPMNGILGFAQLLREPGLTGEEQQKFLGIIEKSGVRMLNIITAIVNISKIDSGQMEISISETNVNEQIDFVYNFFKPVVEGNGMQLIVKNALPLKESIIKSDCEKIYSILTNLVGNATKFTHAGIIEFGYTKKGKYLEFFVKDTGDGIADEKKEIIFERFRQGSESMNRNYQGAGLGLSISKAYVEMLGGKIWVESELGKGSAFYFTIPYNAETEPEIVTKEPVSTEDKDGLIKNLKILIAEDDEASEMFLSTILTRLHKKLLKARTGVEAVEICRNNPDIDLVLMDIRMPEMNGDEATRQIREFNKDVVIIAQTAYGLSGDREKAIDAGCTDYISKPIDVALLKALISKHCKK